MFNYLRQNLRLDVKIICRIDCINGIIGNHSNVIFRGTVSSSRLLEKVKFL